LGAGGRDSDGHGLAGIIARHDDPGEKNIALPGLADRAAAGSRTAPAAHSCAQDDSGPLDWIGAGGGKKPAGAAHDRGGRAPDATPVAGEDREFRVDWPGGGTVAGVG